MFMRLFQFMICELDRLHGHAVPFLKRICKANDLYNWAICELFYLLKTKDVWKNLLLHESQANWQNYDIKYLIISRQRLTVLTKMDQAAYENHQKFVHLVISRHILKKIFNGILLGSFFSLQSLGPSGEFCPDLLM